MTRDTPKGKVQRKRVTSTLERPGATGVILMGDFSHWDPRKHTMSHTTPIPSRTASGP